MERAVPHDVTTNPYVLRGKRWWVVAGWATLLGTVIGGAIFPGAASAADESEETVQWALDAGDSISGERRVTIDYTLEPGTAIADEVIVRNLGDRDLTLDFYATDALVTSDGSFTVLPADVTPVALGAWITPEFEQATVPANDSIKLPITITVPKNATPGDHAAGILATRRSAEAGEATEMAVEQRTGTRVYVRVNGELEPALSVSALSVRYDATWWPFRRGPATVDYTIANTGNVRLAGSARVTLEGPFSVRVAGSGPIEVPDLLPGGAISGSLDLVPGAPPGRLSAVLDVDGLNLQGTVPVEVPHEQHVVGIWAMPWAALAGVATIVAIWWLRRRRLVGALKTARVQVALAEAERDAHSESSVTL